MVIAIQFATVWLTFRTAKAALSAPLVIVITFGAVALVTLVDVFLTVASPALAAAFIVSSLLYVVAPVVIVRDVANRRLVDQETVLGAIAAYLIVGMCFAFTYRAIGAVQPIPFFGAAGTGDMADALFFSFTTLTTTGYGNLVPATNPGQSLAVMEAVLGQLFLVTALAKIVTAWKPKRWQRPDEPE
ncbi:MAG TPA: ion channel [Microlunatus sp.]|nr:ion channel [Microlunatus sp.]